VSGLYVLHYLDFHGLHIFIGTTFVTTCLLRHITLHFSSNHHFGFEAAPWYWHVVDVFWLFLYISIYNYRPQGRRSIGDPKNIGESNYNPGDGTDQRVQSLVFMMMMMMISIYWWER